MQRSEVGRIIAVVAIGVATSQGAASAGPVAGTVQGIDNKDVLPPALFWIGQQAGLVRS